MHDASLVWRFPESSTTTRRGFRRALIEIWHEDQGSEGDCKNWNKFSDRAHWTVIVIPWRRLTRKLFQRCARCGGPSTKKNPVNHGYWDDRTYPFYFSKPLTFHADCITKYSRQQLHSANHRRIEGYNVGYIDGRDELFPGAGFHIPDQWRKDSEL